MFDSRSGADERRTSLPIGGLLDDGIIDRWARLFAARFQMPDRVDEFAARIVGALASNPVLAGRHITSDADAAAVFEYARTTIENAVGRTVMTVAASVRSSYRAERHTNPGPGPTAAVSRLAPRCPGVSIQRATTRR